MENEKMVNNKLVIKGTIDSEFEFSHEQYGERFYEFFLAVPRWSGQVDRLPATVSERLLLSGFPELGSEVAVTGEFRSYNKVTAEKSKLLLTVFVRDFIQPEVVENPNVIEITGYVCKPPIYRTTPFNREISDVLLAVNRAYGKSDYIPCIAWGRNARFMKTIKVGQQLSIKGRIQSREYSKKLEEDVVEVMTAYELSITAVGVVDKQ